MFDWAGKEVLCPVLTKQTIKPDHISVEEWLIRSTAELLRCLNMPDAELNVYGNYEPCAVSAIVSVCAMNWKQSSLPSGESSLYKCYITNKGLNVSDYQKLHNK